MEMPQACRLVQIPHIITEFEDILYIEPHLHNNLGEILFWSSILWCRIVSNYIFLDNTINENAILTSTLVTTLNSLKYTNSAQ